MLFTMKRKKTPHTHLRQLSSAESALNQPKRDAVADSRRSEPITSLRASAQSDTKSVSEQSEHKCALQDAWWLIYSVFMKRQRVLLPVIRHFQTANRVQAGHQASTMDTITVTKSNKNIQVRHCTFVQEKKKHFIHFQNTQGQP